MNVLMGKGGVTRGPDPVTWFRLRGGGYWLAYGCRRQCVSMDAVIKGGRAVTDGDIFRYDPADELAALCRWVTRLSVERGTGIRLTVRRVAGEGV